MTVTDERLEEWKALAEKATGGPWYAGHLSDDSHPCNCAYVLCENYCGAICSVDANNGKMVGNGGNDAPPLEEAKANQLLIAASRVAIPSLIAEVERLREALYDIEGKCADAIGGRINYRAGDLQIIARTALQEPPPPLIPSPGGVE